MRTTLASVIVAFAAAPCFAADSPNSLIQFNRDVRPILADTCYHCHGPDKARRKGDLRLDVEDAARAAIGKLSDSELLRRVTTADADEQMPPKNSGRKLSPQQIDTLKKWVAQGAKWEKHWAFIPPTRAELPAVKNAGWVRNPIDRFILARLEREGLSPSAEASKTTLIRRMSLDLTGLPPTPEEVEAFVKDQSPNAVAQLADRLLASPRYGERMAWRWLEAARYADTNGYQTDAERDMWRWRDWVIEAYNRNLPFDQFTVEQTAGDLLPKATLDQRIATGFHRNHRGNSEGGIVPAEYAAEYVVDRVETTATVWLGLTLGCTRCHDHKYDPFTQKDFYRLFAFFNNVPEKGRAVKYGNSPPFVKAPTREQQRKLAEHDTRVSDAEKRLNGLQTEIAAAQEQWEKAVKADEMPDWSPDRGQVGRWNFEGSAPTIREGTAAFVPGRIGQALDLDGKRFADAGNVGDYGFDDRFSFAFWIKPRKLNGAILSRTLEEPRADGYGVHLVDGKIFVHLTKRWLDDALRLETERPVEAGRWQHVVVTYDGSRAAAGVKITIDGVAARTKVLLDELNQTFSSKEPLRIGTGGGQANRFDGLVDDLRVYGRTLDAQEASLLAVPASVAELLRTPSAKRTPAEQDKLRTYFLELAAPKPIRDAYAAVRSTRVERTKYWESLPTVMVMEEMPTPRDTHVLLRGEYDKLGEKVSAGVPGTLPALPANAPSNRVGFARWLVDPANPLTARVAVNRIWQLHFGTGLVKTVEDFGTQGEYPSHPELLDWLATEFIRTGWDVKAMHKLIVTSATYRQSSKARPDALARDPDNRLLARFPRYRLSADVVRDQALFASGLLVEKLGGPSVKPYQPAGLWSELTGDKDYQPDTGEGLYRRSLYTYWKRTAAPPSLAAFDAATREACWVRETRTNTPLQALTLLNDVAFVEAARMMAQRAMREAKSPDERLSLAFRRSMARSPSEAELRVLRTGLEQHLAEYRKDIASARKLLAIGEAKADAKLDPAELAAYTAICSLILNLDETVTKE